MLLFDLHKTSYSVHTPFTTQKECEVIVFIDYLLSDHLINQGLLV